MTIGADPTRLEINKGIVAAAFRSATGQPLGFLDLGNCPELKVSPSVDNAEHKENRTGRNLTDKIIETGRKMMLSMTLESSAKDNLLKYFYAKAETANAATISNEVVVGWKGREMPLTRMNLTAFTSLTSADGVTTYTKDPGTSPDIYISDFNASTDTFTANAHGLANGTRVWVDAGTMPTGFSTSTNYYVINTALNTFQLSATQGGAAVNASTNGAGILVTIQFDYDVDLKNGVLKFYEGATFSDGASLRANYAAGSSEKVFAYTEPNQELALLIKGINIAENEAPVRTTIFKARLKPVNEWVVIGSNNEFNRYQIEGEVLYDDLQPEASGRFFVTEKLEQTV